MAWKFSLGLFARFAFQGLDWPELNCILSLHLVGQWKWSLYGEIFLRRSLKARRVSVPFFIDFVEVGAFQGCLCYMTAAWNRCLTIDNLAWRNFVLPNRSHQDLVDATVAEAHANYKLVFPEAFDFQGNLKSEEGHQEQSMAAKTSVSTSLKEYLKRYEANDEEDKKKKKKKKKTKPDALGVLVVDEDPIWQKPVNLGEEENGDDSADEEKPQIDEDIEVKRMKRLEQLRSRRPYNVISEDGSGWVPISDAPKCLNSDDQISDMSPPRKWRAWYDTPSPEPELKPSESGREATDLSPPWPGRKRYHTPSPEPETKSSHSIGLNPDISPPRRPRPQTSADNKRKNSVIPDMPDISPPWRVRRSSPYQDVLRASPGADLSPPRKNRKDFRRPGSPDLSPQHSHRYSTENEASRVSLGSYLSPLRKSQKELSSLKERSKTGLITGQDIKEENSKTKKDDWLRFKEMDPSISGRGAEPVYRDKIKGERISKDEFLKSQKGEEKPKEKKLEWGKGLAQKREAEARQQELELEKDKPFARTRDDPELDKMLKERVRWGDPMAHLVKKKHYEPILPDLGDSGKMKESGFIIPQDIPNHSWIKRGLDAAPNRYGIRPGRHWDGVDRSNGFEKGLFKKTNDKQATEWEAYLWSVSDM